MKINLLSPLQSGQPTLIFLKPTERFQATSMTSKERTHAALRRMPVDRVPIFIWFHPETTERFGALLDIPTASVPEAMGNDIRQTWVNNNFAMEGITHTHEGDSHTDFWGIKWQKVGAFNQIVRSPLADVSAEEILEYDFPYERTEELLALMIPIISESSAKFIGCDVSPSVFEMYFRLRGMDNALLDMAVDPELAHRMLGSCADFAVTLASRACERFKLDWLWTGDDVAGQESLLMGPALWREQVKPHLKRVFDVAKTKGIWLAYHCCGSLRPIIGDLIEMGLDVLNPIQCDCPGMDPFELKREFGQKLSFMGGVDTTRLLPYGSPAEVRRDTARLIEVMTADGGGYILAASHAIPPETPDENIFAMFEAAGVGREEIYDRAADLRRAGGAKDSSG